MMSNFLKKFNYSFILVFASACIASVYMPEVFALSDGDRVAELKTLTDETIKTVKNITHLIGWGSIPVVVYNAVITQNIKAAVTGTVISISAFRATTFFTATALI